LFERIGPLLYKIVCLKYCSLVLRLGCEEENKELELRSVH